MTDKVNLAGGLQMSRIVHGQMRMAAWKRTNHELLHFFEELADLGITTFDHADIYGNYTCEALLGDVMALNPGFRNRIEIVTKCGIKLMSDKFPERKVKHYDYSYEHIVGSVETSLRNFRTDRIDLLLLHRPAPFFDAEEVAYAFSDLHSAGKVLHFGVSNFLPVQFDLLQSCMNQLLVTNQVEISPYCLEHFENGNLDFLYRQEIMPMAWSPMAGGRLYDPGDEKGQRIMRVVKEVTAEVGAAHPDEVIIAWLLKHPAGILPVVGTGSMERIRQAIAARELEMTLEQWYRIFIASRGRELP